MKKRLSFYLLAFFSATSVMFSSAVTERRASENDKKAFLELYGWYVGKEAGISEIGLSNEELKQLFQGFIQAANNNPPPENSYEIAPQMQVFLQERANAYKKERDQEMAIESSKNIKSSQDYFTELAKNPKVDKSGSGLYYTIVEEGKGAKPSTSSQVVVHYEGKLINGDVFDSSRRRGEPATFPVGGVIPGFKEGIMLLSEGGKATLYIPADLAYGNADIPGIPPGSTLIFDIELVKVL